MKKKIGYGFKLSSETWEYALSVYKEGGFCISKKEVRADIQRGKKSGDIPQKAKPKMFQVIVEVL